MKYRFKLLEGDITAQGVKAFNKSLNKTALFGIHEKKLRGNITQKGIDAFNDDLMNEIWGDEGLLDEATLKKRSSLRWHYDRHVKAPNAPDNRDNRKKYDNMSMEDYYNYAKKVSALKETSLIDVKIKKRQEAFDIIDDFRDYAPTNSVLKIDYNLKNKSDGRDMFVIVRKQSEHSPLMDMCLVNKEENEPITIFAINTREFDKKMNEFLQIP